MSSEKKEQQDIADAKAVALSSEDNPLSGRERDVSRLLVTGATNSEIARELVISPHTVKVHLRNVFEKLQVSSRTEASMVLLQRGWVTMPGLAVPDLENDEPEPEAEPLDDVPAQPLLWQRVYLIGAIFVCLLALILPSFRSSPKSSQGLLSDAGQTVMGKPSVEVLPRWEVRTPLFQPISRMGVAQTDNLIYIIGGENKDGRAAANVDAYDARFNQWQTIIPMPIPLANVASAALDGRIYVAGGSTNDPERPSDLVVTDQLLVYDPGLEEWKMAGTLPQPLSGASMVASDDALYLMGGWDGEAMHDEVWRLKPDPELEPERSDRELIDRMEVPLAFFGATRVEDSIYVVGGYDGQREVANAYVYDLPSGEWRHLPSLSTPRSGLSVVYDGLAILALGGGWTRAVSNHERYDPLTDQWSNFPSPIRDEWRHLAAAGRDGSIYLIGGWSGDYLDTHLQFQSTFRALLPVISND